MPAWMLELKKERRHRKRAPVPGAGGISTEPAKQKHGGRQHGGKPGGKPGGGGKPGRPGSGAAKQQRPAQRPVQQGRQPATKKQKQAA